MERVQFYGIDGWNRGAILMSDELTEKIKDLVHYYNHHTVEKMVEKHPGFVAEDFSKLLEMLDKEVTKINS